MAKSGQHGGNVLEIAEKYGLNVSDILDFSANINPLGMPDSLKQAIIGHLSLAERYPDIEYRQLHAALARHNACPQSWVLAGNGATELIFALVQQIKPEKAMLLVPGFAEYRRALERAGCEIVNYPLFEEEDFQPNERLLTALTDDLDCLFLCTPNNPTGQQPDKALLQAIAAVCHQKQIALIVDESFIDFLPHETGMVPLLADYPNLYVLRSLTKFFAIPGLRLGYLLSANTVAVSQMRDYREPWTINAFAALAGEMILDDREYIQATHRWLAAEQTHLFNALNTLPGLRVWRPAANYIFFHCLRDNLDLQKALLQHHILIRHCANYPGLTANHYRVAIKSPEDNVRLIRAMQQVFTDG